MTDSASMLRSCRLCPRNCGVDRTAGQTGFCGCGAEARLARASLHFWEEPCVSGTAGSGTVFFSDCNMRCVFCQNHDISQGGSGRTVGTRDLAAVIESLGAKGPHNINLVSPTQYTPQIMAALERTTSTPPVVWNSNAYENAGVLRLLEGIVDVYLPDLKYCDDDLAIRYSSAPGYFAAATASILEMVRQVGPVVLDERGIARKGLIVRHLVLPGHVDDSRRVLEWIAGNMPRGVYVSLMSQYIPAHNASGYAGINRRLTQREYDEIVDRMISLGLEDGYCQDLSSASPGFTPPFDLEGLG